ncbi:Sensor histidine kinase LiaS [Pontiella desulfatans]|uniref:Oxygen sensor histidine kinase NreB n=1 Tax=Pontiella desulfatans TaxID=2750659 RepID=A0A6C2U8E0_PONDE|nr:ATP-binding protein [Pontiella desulfatans]VGO15676.1 Sensor histidine kinase LiaS [Pontiella desulfatans]
MDTTFPIPATLISAALFGSLLAGTIQAQPPGGRGYSDPCFPEEAGPPSAGIAERGMGALEKRERMEQEKLEQLPQLESRIAPPHQYFGYLGGRHPAGATNDTMEAWVQLSFFGKWTSSVDGIALVPAFYPAFSDEGNYGFPKRFKIEIFSHQEPDVPVTVVDWTAADFPDPGLHPVFFSFAARAVQTVRLTVNKGVVEGDSQFFALDELMVFQQGNNVAPPAYQGLTASDSLNEPPYWKLQYLTDRKIHAGGYFHTHHPAADFVQYFDEETIRLATPEIIIDLGEARNIGRVELYPAKLPGMPIPEFAFPLEYQVELRRWLKTEPAIQSGIIEDTLPSRMRWHPLSSAKGRFVRLILHELPRHDGRPVFAMGEIRLMGREGNQLNNLAAGASIRVTQTPEGEAADTRLLTDGYSNGRKIIPERDYIEQLAARKILVEALAETQHRLMIARATRNSYYWMVGMSGGTILFFSLILWIAYQRIARQRALMDLRRQIAADLHDDISSNLGTISMITRRLQQDSSPALIRDKLMEIGHIAQESFISIKEIIWHMDSDIVHLSEMFEKLERTARSVLTDCQVDFTYPPPQGIPVPAKTRRNIMLLVKEALYNCAKYAQAKHMSIQAAMHDSVLELTMKDDGIGFDPSCTVVANSDSGRGLANMERRAKLLGAELEIQSTPGQGTQVTLKMPL